MSYGITCYVRRLPLDGEDQWSSVSQNGFATLQNSYLNTTPTEYWYPWNLNSNNGIGTLQIPTYTSSSKDLWDEGFSCTGFNFVEAYPSLSSPPSRFVVPFSNTYADLGYAPGDSSWAYQGWTTSDDSTFQTQLCTFFAANMQPWYPWATTLDVIIFRGVFAGFAVSAAFCYPGNDPDATAVVNV